MLKALAIILFTTFNLNATDIQVAKSNARNYLDFAGISTSLVKINCRATTVNALKTICTVSTKTTVLHLSCHYDSELDSSDGCIDLGY